MEEKALFQKFFNRYIWSTNTAPVQQRAVNLENADQRIDGFALSEVFSQRKTSSGAYVDNDSSLQFSAVWACIRLISGIPSYLPFQIFEKTSTGRRLATEHRLYHLISKKPNSYMTRQVFIERFVKNIIGWGNGYAIIKETAPGVTEGFEILKPKEVKVFRNNNEVSYKVEGMADAVPYRLMIHVPHLGDDIVGKSTLQYMREDVGLEFATRDYGASIFGDGIRPPGLISTEQNLSEKQQENLGKQWKAAKAQGGDAVLSNGLKYQPLSIPPDDAQFIASRKFNVTTIARWFGVPNHKINEEDRSTFSNIEHQAIAFLQDTIAPLLAKIEGEFTSKIFLPSESNLYTEFNLDAYLRADSQARAEMFRTGIQNGFYSQNEVREKLNLDMRPGSDELFIQKNMIPSRLAAEIAMAEANKAPTQTPNPAAA